MKHLPILLASFLGGLCPLLAQQPADAKRNAVKIALVGGDSITGTISGVADG